jgi:hypothetical protein
MPVISRRTPTVLLVTAGLLAAPAAAFGQARAQDLRSPDAVDAADRAAAQDLRSPDAKDAADRTTAVIAAGAVPRIDGTQADDGFDAGDAAIGAGAAVGLLLLAGAAGTTAARLRRAPGAER